MTQAPQSSVVALVRSVIIEITSFIISWTFAFHIGMDHAQGTRIVSECVLLTNISTILHFLGDKFKSKVI